MFLFSLQFQFDFQQNKPWQYDNLYAPVDFAILKSEDQLEQERAEAENSIIPYFNYDQDIANEAKAAYENQFSSVFTDSIFRDRQSELKNIRLLGVNFKKGFGSFSRRQKNILASRK